MYIGHINLYEVVLDSNYNNYHINARLVFVSVGDAMLQDAVKV